MKKKPAEPASWVDVRTETVTGDTLLARHPTNPVTVLARPGMLMEVPNESELAVIEVMTDEFVIGCFESGRRDVWRWGEVAITAVRPDPKFVVS